LRKLVKPRSETDIEKVKNFVKTTEGDRFQELVLFKSKDTFQKNKEK
jgi:hypothetical protein